MTPGIFLGRRPNWKGGVNITPAVYAGLGGRRPDMVASRYHLEDTFVFLERRNGDPLLDIRTASRICLGDKTGPITRVKDGQLRVVRIKRPNAVIMHCQRMHASSRRQGPDLNCLVRRCSHDRVPIAIY